MQDKYEMIESFPSSWSKYEVSYIAATLEGSNLNACDDLYDKVDHRETESVEEIIEYLAFEKQDRLQLFLDAKNHYFNSRRVDEDRLYTYLKESFDYDVKHLNEFKDDKNSLFLILFNESYVYDENSLNKKFTEARVASHKFKERRNRMTHIDEKVHFGSFEEKIEDFESLINSGGSGLVKSYTYEFKTEDAYHILIRRQKPRTVEPVFDYHEDDPTDIDLIYEERYNVEENALRLEKVGESLKIQSYRSVNSWENVIQTLFSQTLGVQITDTLQSTGSSGAKEVIESVKKHTDDEEGNAKVLGTQVPDIVSSTIESEVQNIDDDETASYAENRIDNMIITGVDVKTEEDSFNISSENGIDELITEYDGLSTSLSQALSNADPEDIKISAVIENNAGENDEIVLENGDWSMSSVSNKKTMRALESALK